MHDTHLYACKPSDKWIKNYAKCRLYDDTTRFSWPSPRKRLGICARIRREHDEHDESSWYAPEKLSTVLRHDYDRIYVPVYLTRYALWSKAIPASKYDCQRLLCPAEKKNGYVPSIRRIRLSGACISGRLSLAASLARGQLVRSDDDDDDDERGISRLRLWRIRTARRNRQILSETISLSSLSSNTGHYRGWIRGWSHSCGRETYGTAAETAAAASHGSFIAIGWRESKIERSSTSTSRDPFPSVSFSLSFFLSISIGLSFSLVLSLSSSPFAI